MRRSIEDDNLAAFANDPGALGIESEVVAGGEIVGEEDGDRTPVLVAHASALKAPPDGELRRAVELDAGIDGLDVVIFGDVGVFAFADISRCGLLGEGCDTESECEEHGRRNPDNWNERSHEAEDSLSEGELDSAECMERWH
jgi:hypothetical protein